MYVRCESAEKVYRKGRVLWEIYGGRYVGESQSKNVDKKTQRKCMGPIEKYTVAKEKGFLGPRCRHREVFRLVVSAAALHGI